MKNAQELIDILKEVPDEKFEQDIYIPFDGSDCGCVMHHYDLAKFGKANYEVDHTAEFGIDAYSSDYIFGFREDIWSVAKEMGWPVPRVFDVDSAIKRIKFIDNLK